MEQTFSITSAQGEILNMMSFLKDENTFVMLKKVISDFFAQKADEELNRLSKKRTKNSTDYGRTAASTTTKSKISGICIKERHIGKSMIFRIICQNGDFTFAILAKMKIL